jgi:hypothetical protein
MKNLSGFHLCDYIAFEREFGDSFGEETGHAFVVLQDLYPMSVCIISIYREAKQQGKGAEVLKELNKLAYGETYDLANLYPPVFSSACLGEQMETPFQVVRRLVCCDILSIQSLAD